MKNAQNKLQFNLEIKFLAWTEKDNAKKSKNLFNCTSCDAAYRECNIPVKQRPQKNRIHFTESISSSLGQTCK